MNSLLEIQGRCQKEKLLKNTIIDVSNSFILHFFPKNGIKFPI